MVSSPVESTVAKSRQVDRIEDSKARHMRTKIGALSIAIAIAAVILSPGPVSASDFVQGNTRHTPSLGHRLRASLFPGFPRPSDAPFIRYFNDGQQQRYAFAEEQEQAVERSRVDPRMSDRWNTTQPVGNVFKFKF